MVRIPLRDRAGNLRAETIIDDRDQHLSGYRWHLDAQGYAARNAPDRDGVKVRPRLHREVCGLAHGDGREVDHINGDKLDNRRANLRVVDDAINAQNHPRYRTSASRFRGVTRRGHRWVARAQVHGRRVTVGRFATEEEAGAAAAAYRRLYMPGAVEGPSDTDGRMRSA